MRSAENVIIEIPPNTNMVIQGYIDKKISFNYASAVLTSTSKSSTPNIDIETSLFYYSDNVSEVEIHVSNVTTRT